MPCMPFCVDKDYPTSPSMGDLFLPWATVTLTPPRLASFSITGSLQLNLRIVHMLRVRRLVIWT